MNGQATSTIIQEAAKRLPQNPITQRTDHDQLLLQIGPVIESSATVACAAQKAPVMALALGPGIGITNGNGKVTRAHAHGRGTHTSGPTRRVGCVR